MNAFSVVDNAGEVVREYARKSDATRYANTNGLTVVENDTTPSDDLNNADIDDVLNALHETDEKKTLRDYALSIAQSDVDSMVASIRESFERRDIFEVANGLDISIDNSYSRERARMLRNEIAVARLFIALDVRASNVIERSLASNKMFNAKALKKITEIAQYVCGYGQKLEKVMRAFIACSIVATNKGHDVLTNEINRRFLNSVGFSSLFKDQELIDYLDSESHRTMSSGAETQSSQSRNVLDVLNLGSVMTVQKHRDAIVIDKHHAFYEQFATDFMK